MSPKATKNPSNKPVAKTAPVAAPVPVVVTRAEKPDTKSKVLADIARLENAQKSAKLVAEGKVLAEKVEAKKVAPAPKLPKTAPVTKKAVTAPVAETKRVRHKDRSLWNEEERAEWHAEMVAARGKNKPAPVSAKVAKKINKEVDKLPYPASEKELDKVYQKAGVKVPTSKVERQPGLSVPEAKFEDLVSEMRVMEKQVAYLSKVVGQFQKFMAHLAEFDSPALTHNPTPSNNSVGLEAEEETEAAPKKARAKRVYTPEERHEIRLRLLKGQFHSKTMKELGAKFTEKKFEKMWADKLVEMEDEE